MGSLLARIGLILALGVLACEQGVEENQSRTFPPLPQIVYPETRFDELERALELSSDETVRVLVFPSELASTNDETRTERTRRIEEFAVLMVDSAPQGSLAIVRTGKTANFWVAKADRSALAYLEELTNLKLLRHVSLDFEAAEYLIESVPLVGAPIAHQSHGVTGLGQTVCVVDSGVDYNHPALGGGIGPGFKVLGGYDFVNSDSDPMDDRGHGTHVAGTVASTDLTFGGVAPDASLVAVKVLNANGTGSVADIVSGIDWCTQNQSNFNISVINLSLGSGVGYGPTTCPSYLYQAAVDAARQAGIVVVAATGNSGVYGVGVPSCVPGVTAVAATYDENLGMATHPRCQEVTATGELTCFSNRHRKIVDVLAPGHLIRSTVSAVSATCGLFPFGNCSGTSMSAPHVAGAAALLLEASPLLSPDGIEHVLSASAPRSSDPKYLGGYPRLELQSTLSSLSTVSIRVPDDVFAGQDVKFTLAAPFSPSSLVVFLAALSDQPPYMLPDGRSVPVADDVLLDLVRNNPAGIGLQHPLFYLDASGFGELTWTIPDFAPDGLVVHVAAITIDPTLPFPQSFTAISSPRQFTVNRPSLEVSNLTLTSPISKLSCETRASTGIVYCFGETNGDVLKFDPLAGALTAVSAPLLQGTGKISCSFVGSEDSFYCFGRGQGGAAVTRFDPTTDMANLEAVSPQRLARTGCSTYGGKVYCFGGEHLGQKLDTIYEYDPANQALQVMTATLPFGRMLVDCTTSNVTNEIVCVGGRTGTTLSLSEITIYDPLNDAIRVAANPYPHSLRMTSCHETPHDGFVTCFGGLHFGGSGYAGTLQTGLDLIATIDPVAEVVVSKRAVLPEGMWGTACAYVPSQSRSYCFGGQTLDESGLTQIYSYVP